jgi:hypothetical protein
MAEEPAPALACPSARAEPGNLLYGRVVDGQVERLGTPLAVTAAFVEAISANGSPERRFRFAGTCQEGRCAQWTGAGCGVIERVLSEACDHSGQAEPTTLPRCFLRASCRWFSQRGGEACTACSLVVTDRREPAGVTQA